MKLPVRLCYRIWLEKGEDTVLGMGIVALLVQVRELGSLKKAAEDMHMSYRGAWGRIRRAEAAFGMPLLATPEDRQRGLELTSQAEELIAAFLRIQQTCHDALSTCTTDFPYLDVHIR